MFTNFLLMAAIVAQGESTSAAELRGQLISILRTRDAQIRSLECDYELSSKSAAQPDDTVLAHWRCQGNKERTDYPTDPGRVDAFDGEVMRSHVKVQEPGVREGRLTRGDQTRRTVKPFPLCWLRLTPAQSLADFLENSPNCEVVRLSQPGANGEIVKASVAINEQMRMELYFDAAFRIQRRELHAIAEDGRDFVGESVVYEQYTKIADAGGASLEFPLKIQFEHHGPDLAWTNSQTLTVANVKLNGNLQDELFVISFPPGMRVFDEFQMRWFGGPDEVKLLEGHGMPAWGRWSLYVGIPLLALALILLFLRSKRVRAGQPRTANK